jgi:hypothetical protein
MGLLAGEQDKMPEGLVVPEDRVPQRQELSVLPRLVEVRVAVVVVGAKLRRLQPQVEMADKLA